MTFRTSLLAALAVAFTVNAQAQSSAQNQTRVDAVMGRPKIGLRFNLINALDSDAKLKASYLGQSGSEKDDTDQEISFGVGYENTSEAGLGFVGNLNQIRFDEAKALRIDANGTIGFSPMAYGFAGLNFQDIDSDMEGGKIKSGMGMQMGAGMKFNETIGATLSYFRTKHDLQIDSLPSGADADATLTSIELALVISI